MCWGNRGAFGRRWGRIRGMHDVFAGQSTTANDTTTTNTNTNT